MNTQVESIEDVEKVVLAGEIIRAHGPWLVAIGDENLGFSKYRYSTRVTGLPRAEAVAGAAVGQRAAGLHVGHQHDALGIEELGRLGHEMHAGE